jgi:hypothetical protein
MRTPVAVALLLAATASPPAVAEDIVNFDGLFAGGRLGLGRNFSPTRGAIRDAAVYEPTLQAGVVLLDSMLDGAVFAATLGYAIGANDATASEPLAGGFFRIVHGGVYGELGGRSGLTSAKYRTSLVELHFGFGMPIGQWAPALALGAQLGQTRDDGFVAIGTVTVELDRYFHVGYRKSRPSGI